MATVLSDTRNFKATQAAFLKQSLEDYSTFLNALPLLVNYYSKNFFASTHDVNLRTVQEILGTDSPVKFNLIKNFPFYKATNLSEADPDESEDVGTEANVEGTALIPPTSVQPREDDLFTIPWYGHKTAVFRVSKVTRSNIRGRAFYTVNYYLYKTFADIEDLKKQVERNYEVVGSPSSANKSAIIAEDKAELVFEIQKKVDSLVEDVSAMFYDRRTDAYMIELDTLPFYLWWDECLHYFVARNNTMSRSRPYRNECHPISYNIEDFPGLYKVYKTTLFWAVENHNFNLMADYLGAYMRMPYHEEVPGRHLRDYVVRGIGYAGSCCTPCKFGFQNVFGNLWEYLRDETDTIKPDLPEAAKYQMLIKFWKNGPVLEQTLKYTKLLTPIGSIIDYYYLPIAIYILRDIINRIRTIYDWNN
jgi:hypothetical protein